MDIKLSYIGITLSLSPSVLLLSLLYNAKTLLSIVNKKYFLNLKYLAILTYFFNLISQVKQFIICHIAVQLYYLPLLLLLTSRPL